MLTLKCKMCGGELEITEEKSVCECEYCGSKQTIPTVDDDKKLKLYERANKLRIACEFDKASGVYESIIADFSDEAEAYWGLLLCKYGIEYVDDPGTGRKIPTCHRSSFDSVMKDESFEMVMENTDSIALPVYREQAKEIEEIRKGIVEVSSNEEPYDIFICYKETDENGDRTLDSVIAQDVYKELTNEGYRVFFSRISLEDKLGQEYEPYIFAALNSAKVMLAFGTKYEYYNAVWVKNEWSRFLKMISSGQKKTLIPCFKNLDAYDMPEEFARLQAQDMGKVGAIQDLVRGIEKIITPKNAQKEVTSAVDINAAIASAMAASTGSNVNALLMRAKDALEDGELDKADKFYEDVLNQDAQNGEAFLGKWLLEYGCTNEVDIKKSLVGKYKNVTSEENFEACEEESEHINEYVKKYEVPGFLEADVLRKNYEFNRKYASSVACRLEQKKIQLKELLEDKILLRCRQYASGETKTRVDCILRELEDILDTRIQEAKTKDSEMVHSISESYAKYIVEVDDKNKILYEKACAERDTKYQATIKQFSKCTTEEEIKTVKTELCRLVPYKDSADYIKQCDEKLQIIKKKREQELIAKQKAVEVATKKKKKTVIISVVAILLILTVVTLLVKVIIPNSKYHHAMKLKETGEYQEAIKEFSSLGSYKDAKQEIEECIELQIQKFIYEGDYVNGKLFCEEVQYEKGILYFDAESYMERGEYGEAVRCYANIIGYFDSESQLQYVVDILETEDVDDETIEKCIEEFNKHKLVSYSNETQYLYAKKMMYRGDYTDAKLVFETISKYEDSKSYIKLCEALGYLDNGQLVEASYRLDDLVNFDPAKKLIELCEEYKDKGISYSCIRKQDKSSGENVSYNAKLAAVHLRFCIDVNGNVTNKVMYNNRLYEGKINADSIEWGLKEGEFVLDLNTMVRESSGYYFYYKVKE